MGAPDAKIGAFFVVGVVVDLLQGSLGEVHAVVVLEETLGDVLLRGQRGTGLDPDVPLVKAPLYRKPLVPFQLNVSDRHNLPRDELLEPSALPKSPAVLSRKTIASYQDLLVVRFKTGIK